MTPLGCFLALAAAIALLVKPSDTGDLPFFIHTSKKLFSADWANVFANPDVQVGPLQSATSGGGCTATSAVKLKGSSSEVGNS